MLTCQAVPGRGLVGAQCTYLLSGQQPGLTPTYSQQPGLLTHNLLLQVSDQCTLHDIVFHLKILYNIISGYCVSSRNTLQQQVKVNSLDFGS